MAIGHIAKKSDIFMEEVMGMHMIPNISEFDKEFYKDAKTRMKKLVNRAMGSDTEIVTQFFGKDKKKTCLVFYQKIDKGNLALSTKDYWIRFPNAKNVPSSLPFLCFQLWDIFQEEKYAVHRYVYFEIHYIDGIFGVLMKHSRFSAPNTGFDEFDLDRREWALAKQQMELWKEYFRPDIYHIKDWSKQKDILYHIFTDDYDEYSGKILPKELHDMDTIWPLVSYITLIQMLPMLPKKYALSHMLNVVTDTPEGKQPLLQTTISLFSLRDKTRPEDVFVANTEKGSPSGKADILPQIVTYQQAKELIPYFRHINKLKEMEGECATGDLPMLLGNGIFYENSVINFSLPNELYQVVKDQDFCSEIRDAMRKNLYKVTAKYVNKHPQIYFPNKSERWDGYCEKLVSYLKDSIAEWEEWETDKELPFLTRDHIYLAAWYSILVNKSISEEEELLSGVCQWLIEENNTRSGSSNVLREFLEDVIENNLAGHKGRPKVQKDVKEIDYPFVDTFKGDDNQVIVFTQNVFESMTKDKENPKFGEQIIALAAKEKLLKTNTDSNENYTVTFRKGENGKAIQERCYVFYLEKAKAYLQKN